MHCRSPIELTCALVTPQDPVIFSGSVRSNLDPFSEAKDDAAVWEALRQAGMDGFVRQLEVRRAQFVAERVQGVVS